ncbi:MAG TPA: ankyrin repeat domain-containing protein [Vicinamibacterales bacterium]|nr:ankyrin repeat domain-containing protein [Vicinamibacterales bacterium]
MAEVSGHYHDASQAGFALHDTQLVIARAYGFSSWPRLKAYVDGVTLRRLDDAIKAGDLARVRAMLHARPELAALEIDNHSLLHHAVLSRAAEMVQLLLEYGAEARHGLYPHHEATSPLAIATARGYLEIVTIIEAAEHRRCGPESAGVAADEAEDLFRAIVTGDAPGAIDRMERRPALIHAITVEGWTALHAAAFVLHDLLCAWLLARGADPNRPGRHGLTPLDAAATGTWRGRSDVHQRLLPVATRLLGHGAAMTARAAVALGDTAWVSARHAEGELPGPVDGIGGLLRRGGDTRPP